MHGFQSLLIAFGSDVRLLTLLQEAMRFHPVASNLFWKRLDGLQSLAVAFRAVASLAIASNDVAAIGSDWKRCYSSGLVVVLAVV